MTEFSEMCCFVAVRQTQRDDDILSEVVQNLLAMSGTPTIRSSADVAALLHDRFGLSVSEHRTQAVVDRMTAGGLAKRSSEGILVLTEGRAAKVSQRLRDTLTLEDTVRQSWFAELAVRRPELDPQQAWQRLVDFSQGAFRQHGLLTLSLVDPSIVVPEEYDVSMPALLDRAVAGTRNAVDRDALKIEIRQFYVDAGTHPDRARYLTQVADGVVSCYALTLPEEVSARLREALKPLTLFLDTNVLFGTIGLDDGPLVAASNELIVISDTHRLPLKLRYHQATERELQKTLEAASSRLKGRVWPPYISRSASTLPTISTIQRLYHQRNAERPITAESFFAPFEHADVLVQGRGVQIYREADDASGRQKLYDMVAEYENFLKKHGREKSYEARVHDMVVLTTVRRLRSESPSSLHAAALLVTYDALLFKFDKAWARRNKGVGCVVLPTQLMQLLRPFLPATEDFDLSFASAFAVPALRAAGGQAHLAIARMVELVASYDQLPQQTAESLLSNSLFLDGLSRARSDEDLRRYIESAIAAENAALAEDNERLKQIAAERSEALSAADAKATARVNGVEEERRRQVAALAETKAALQAEVFVERERTAELDMELSNELAKRRADHRELDGLRGRLETLERQNARAQEARKTWRALFFAGVACAVLMRGIWSAARWLNWDWLLSHPNGLSLLGLGGFATAALVYGLCQPKHRNVAFVAGAVGALLVALGLLGSFPSPH